MWGEEEEESSNEIDKGALSIKLFPVFKGHVLC